MKVTGDTEVGTLIGFRERGGKLLKTGVLGIRGKTVENVIALTRRLKEKINGRVGGKAGVLGAKSLIKEAIEDGSGLVMGLRGKTRKPGAVGIAGAQGERGRSIDGKGSTVIGNLVEVRNQLVMEIMS